MLLFRQLLLLPGLLILISACASHPRVEQESAVFKHDFQSEVRPWTHENFDTEEGIDIANLRLSGIFDKTKRIPLNGEGFCFEIRKCVNEVEQ